MRPALPVDLVDARQFAPRTGGGELAGVGRPELINNGRVTTRDAQDAAHARDRLRRLCTDLVDPQTATVERDDGTVTRHVAPSLLDQLRGAVATGCESGTGARGTSRGLPIATEAHDLLAAIQADVDNWPWAEHGPLEQRIRGCVATLCRTVDTSGYDTVCRHLTAWCTDIRALLTPRLRKHIAAPCPRCHATMAHVRDTGTGDRVQVHALQVAPAPDAPGRLHCQCQACGAVWPETHFHLLARVLN